MLEQIGFIGLGNLGLPMATNLVNAGYSVRVHNRTASKAESLVAQGAEFADRPVDAVTPGGIVATIVWDDAAVESVVMSDGFLERLAPGGIHLCMSTISPEMAKKLAQLHAQHGSVYVESPIFGRAEATVGKKLWIPIAGPQEAKKRVKPVLEAMGGQEIFDFGEKIGSASVVKIIGNFLGSSAVRSMSEALHMAEKQGVDPTAVVNMLTTTLFAAPIYQSYGKMLAEKSYSPNHSKIPLKDVGLFIKAAEQVDSPTHIAGFLRDLMISEA